MCQLLKHDVNGLLWGHLEPPPTWIKPCCVFELLNPRPLNP